MIAGPLLFARYAFPPNERGLCGPADNAALRGHATAGDSGPGLRHLAGQFAGAWPYLQLIAAANGIRDPLDGRVVEAYWVGNSLLGNIRIADYGAFLDDRFRREAGRGWASIASAIPAGALPHHSFHVFCVYPWTGLLRAGRAEPSLHVLDSCRISWGWVVTTDPLVIARRPLTWDGRVLSLGPPEPCQVAAGFVTGLRYGDWVSVHWSSVCDRLTPAQLCALRRYEARHLRLANAPGGHVLELAEARLSPTGTAGTARSRTSRIPREAARSRLRRRCLPRTSGRSAGPWADLSRPSSSTGTARPGASCPRSLPGRQATGDAGTVGGDR